MNSEFSFSQTSCLTKAEEPSLPYYLPIAGWRIIGFIPFPRCYVKCNQSGPGFELLSPCPYPATITLNGNRFTAIVTCNRPTDARNETGITTYYNELSSFVRNIPKHNFLIICRVINALISKDENYKSCERNIPVMLGLWEIWSTPSLPLLPGPLWPGMVAHDRALFMG